MLERVDESFAQLLMRVPRVLRFVLLFWTVNLPAPAGERSAPRVNARSRGLTPSSR